MQDNNLLTGHQWQPLKEYGLTHKFWTLNTHTLTSTLFITILIILFSLYAHYTLQKKQSILKFIILKYVESFKDLLNQTLQSAPLHHLAFIGSLFTFLLCCNTISFIPFLEEPTKDLNTTLAFGLISFFYVQGYALQHKGIKEYFADFLQPFFLMLPLHVIGKVTSIISLSFRLFGNIFGGYVISNLYFNTFLPNSIYLQVFGLITGMNLFLQCVFGFFEGTIQAFVFAMLTLTYLSMEIAPEEEPE